MLTTCQACINHAVDEDVGIATDGRLNHVSFISAYEKGMSHGKMSI